MQQVRFINIQLVDVPQKTAIMFIPDVLIIQHIKT
jgi:hypothetical protein